MLTLRPALIGLAAAASLVLVGCNDSREMEYKDVEIAEYKRQIRELEDQLAKQDNAHVSKALQGSGSGVNTDQLQAAAGKDIDISTAPVEVIMSVESDILFKSGSATLSAQAKSALNKAIAIVKEKFPNHEIRVVGHTDDNKITRSRNEWDDNWDLSAGRALTVRKYLEEHGIAASKLGIAGYADQRPRVPNLDGDSRSKNRRVEIVVIPMTGAAAPAK
jgi:chemotaxis protein MotB